MNYTSSGNLIVKTYIAHEALPIPGALVRINGVNEENHLIEYSLLTDEDGVTEAISLPAPAVEYSQAPNPAEVPYAPYDVEIERDGFYTKLIRNIAIFSGVNTILPVNMIPYRQGDDYPIGNIDATSSENQYLE